MQAKRQKQSIRRLRKTVAVLLLLTVGIPWIFLDTWFGFTAKEKEQRVTVPNFCGERYESLSFDPWQKVDAEYRYDPNVPAGIVTAQSPEAGSVRKLSNERSTCRIMLTVSLGTEQVRAKNVTGTDVREAVQILRADGFAVNTVMKTGPYPEGRVLDMSPTGVLLRGTSITLTVSAGEPAKTVEVPDLKGLSRADALIRLWTSQLAVGEVIEEASDKEEGTVIRQSHQPGTVVMAGTKIKLYVSKEKTE